MKILVVSNLYPPAVVGGYEILCAQVAEALSSSGHQVRVLTSRIDGDRRREDATASPRVIRELELTSPFGAPARNSRLRRHRIGRWNASVAEAAVREWEPDVVFVWSQLRLTVAVARACEGLGIPVCYTMNDAHLAGFLPRRFAATPRSAAGAFLDRVVVPRDTVRGLRLDRVTCISRVVADHLAEEGVAGLEPRVIHQGIPIERFPLKERPGSRHDPVRLLYAGQLHDYKGPQHLLEALARLSDSAGPGPSFQLTIAGAGPLRGDLERRALERRLPVTFTGALGHERMPGLYRDHDVLAFPSTWKEPFGLTHLEAMASGTPVISTTVGGQAEFLRDGENALTVPPADPEALAGAIRRLAEDDALRRRLAIEGRKTVERHFTLSRYVTELEGWLTESSHRRTP